MSQTTITESFNSYHTPEVTRSTEFSYRPIPVLAPVTLTAGVMSAIGLLFLAGLPFGVIGMITGAICLVKIRRSGGELGGTKITVAGTLLSAGFLTGGVAWHSYAYATEVPDGYQRVNFSRDVSDKDFEMQAGAPVIHEDVETLNGKLIHIKGYIYPTLQTEDIRAFLLVKDSGQCCFGGQPKLNDMIMVRLRDGKSTDYIEGLVAVAGTFHTKGARGPANLTPIYSMDGDQVEQAKTQF